MTLFLKDVSKRLWNCLSGTGGVSRKWRNLLVLVILGVVFAVVAQVTGLFRSRPALERIQLEQTREPVESIATSQDVAWTQQERAESADSTRRVRLVNGVLSGELFASERDPENPCCTWSQNGFRNFEHSRFPGRSIFLSAGLNFEHLISGRAKDWDGDGQAGNFAPRREPSTLRVYSESSAGLFWAAANSRWGANSEMKFSLDGECHVDLEFRTALERVPDADYLLYMWASYLRGVRISRIQFWGVKDWTADGASTGKGSLGWVSLEAPVHPDPTELDRGVVRFLGTPTLPYEKGVERLNFEEIDSCAFLLPFFFGVVDGDGDLSSAEDDMAYIMMFDQSEQIRFAMWDFSVGAGNPVWDWQYVLRRPVPERTYGYRARVVYKPYLGPDDAVAEYVQWVKSLGEPRHHLKIEVVPPESAALFPKDSEGTYGENVQVHFGVNPSPGWVFDHWEGNVTYTQRRFTRIKMMNNEVVRAVCRPVE